MFGSFAELVSAGGVPNHQPAKPAVPDENVGSKAEDEVGHPQLASRAHGIRESIGGRGFVE